MTLQPPDHSLQVEMVDDVAVVQLTEKQLDKFNIEAVAQRLFNLAERSSHRQLYLDFGHVGLVRSYTLGKLVALHKKLRAAGGRLTVHNVGPGVYRACQVTHLTTLLDVRPKEAVRQTA